LNGRRLYSFVAELSDILMISAEQLDKPLKFLQQLYFFDFGPEQM